MARIVAPLGWPFEIIIAMSDTLTLTDGATNLVLVVSGGGTKTLTLPSIQQMVASQNPTLFVVNQSDSGGTVTVAANAADAIKGRVTSAVSTGLTLRHDGLHTWFGM